MTIKEYLSLGILVLMSTGLGYWYHVSQIELVGFGCGICTIILGLIALNFITDF